MKIIVPVQPLNQTCNFFDAFPLNICYFYIVWRIANNSIIKGFKDFDMSRISFEKFSGHGAVQMFNTNFIPL